MAVGGTINTVTGGTSGLGLTLYNGFTNVAAGAYYTDTVETYSSIGFYDYYYNRH